MHLFKSINFWGLALSLAASVSASPLASFNSASKRAAPPLPDRVIAQFPVDVWVENLAVRHNGNILVTSLLPNASLYEISNPTSAAPTVTRIFTIGSVGSLLGITETSQDVFAVAGGSFDLATGGIKGTFSVFKVDFTESSSPEPHIISAIPDAVLLNGAETVPENTNLVLFADSGRGVVWRVDTDNGDVVTAFDVPEMDPAPIDTFTIGVNGIRIHDGYLWFTNQINQKFCKIEVTDHGLPHSGSHVQTVATFEEPGIDDFAFGPGSKDLAWMATNTNHTILAVNTDGDHFAAAGSIESFEVGRSTSSAFGRTAGQLSTLYVTSGITTVNGVTKGGKVQAVYAAGFACP